MAWKRRNDINLGELIVVASVASCLWSSGFYWWTALYVFVVSIFLVYGWTWTREKENINPPEKADVRARQRHRSAIWFWSRKGTVNGSTTRH